ncbi:MAG: hypothetical protein CBE33_06605 [Candidatus Pelagibacter sp. TMED273]|nr:MAG: hypothetical protein CBE33_06605 [Candidatus Pelagibacter sp. TMED273]
MNYLIFFVIPVFIYLLNSYIIKNKYLLNFSGETHQKFLGTKKAPLSGGIFLILFLSTILIEKDIMIYFF